MSHLIINLKNRMDVIRHASVAYASKRIIEMNESVLDAFRCMFSNCRNDIVNGTTLYTVQLSTILDGIRHFANVSTYFDAYRTEIQEQFEQITPIAFDSILELLNVHNSNTQCIHKHLLLSLRSLLENVQTDILKNYALHKIQYLSTLWSKIAQANDYKTQADGLDMLMHFLKHLEPDTLSQRMQEHFEVTLKDKLVLVASYYDYKKNRDFENLTRDFLNYYNAGCLNQTVFSVYCSFACFNDRYTFYKPMNCDKFWIDFNYLPRTISFYGQYVSTEKSIEVVYISLKVNYIERENETLHVYYEEFKQSEIEDLRQSGRVCLGFPKQEMSRILENVTLQRVFHFRVNDCLDFAKDSIINNANTSTPILREQLPETPIELPETPKLDKPKVVTRLQRHSIRSLRNGKTRRLHPSEGIWRPYQYNYTRKSINRVSKSKSKSNSFKTKILSGTKRSVPVDARNAVQKKIQQESQSCTKISSTPILHQQPSELMSFQANESTVPDVHCDDGTPNECASTSNRNSQSKSPVVADSDKQPEDNGLKGVLMINEPADFGKSEAVNAIVSKLFKDYEEALLKQWYCLKEQNECLSESTLNKVVGISESIVKGAINLNDMQTVLLRSVEQHSELLTQTHLESYVKKARNYQIYFDMVGKLMDGIELEDDLEKRHENWLKTFKENEAQISHHILRTYIKDRLRDLAMDIRTFFPLS